MGLNYDFDPEDPNLKLTTSERVRIRAAAAAERKAKYFPVPRSQLALEAPAEEAIEVKATPEPVTIETMYGPPVWMCRPLKIADIQAAVSFYSGVSVHEMKSSLRTRRYVRARQIAMAASRYWTNQSFPEIGRRFGNRDHTTALYGFRQVVLKRTAGDADYLRICEDVARYLGREWPDPTDGELAEAGKCTAKRGVQQQDRCEPHAKPRHGSGWTDERLERLRALSESGLSASAIARELGGVSRNAVIGKLYRLGWGPPVVVEKKVVNGDTKPAVTVRAKNHGRNTAQRVKAKRKAAVEIAKHAEPPLPAPTFLGAKHFADLEPGECSYPLGDGDMRCAAPCVEGSPYCAHHLAACGGRRRKPEPKSGYVAIGQLSEGTL